MKFLLLNLQYCLALMIGHTDNLALPPDWISSTCKALRGVADLLVGVTRSIWISDIKIHTEAVCSRAHRPTRIDKYKHASSKKKMIPTLRSSLHDLPTSSMAASSERNNPLNNLPYLFIEINEIFFELVLNHDIKSKRLSVWWRI